RHEAEEHRAEHETQPKETAELHVAWCTSVQAASDRGGAHVRPRPCTGGRGLVVFVGAMVPRVHDARQYMRNVPRKLSGIGKPGPAAMNPVTRSPSRTALLTFFTP